jgi:hypothetical protein
MDDNKKHKNAQHKQQQKKNNAKNKRERRVEKLVPCHECKKFGR